LIRSASDCWLFCYIIGPIIRLLDSSNFSLICGFLDVSRLPQFHGIDAFLNEHHSAMMVDFNDVVLYFTLLSCFVDAFVDYIRFVVSSTWTFAER